MLKELQRVRDVLEEVTHIYVELTVLGDELREEGCLTLVFSKATEVILDVNSLIHSDVGYSEYFAVHSKIMRLCAHMGRPSAQHVKDWLLSLIEADNEAIKGLLF